MKRIVSLALSFLLLITAVFAIPGQKIKADEAADVGFVSVWIKPPVAGETPTYQVKKEHQFMHEEDYDRYEVVDIGSISGNQTQHGVYWSDPETNEGIDPENTFIAGKVYIVNIFLQTLDASFVEDVSVLINDSAANVERLTDTLILIQQVFIAEQAIGEVEITLPEPKVGDLVDLSEPSDYTVPNILSVDGEIIGFPNQEYLSSEGPGPGPNPGLYRQWFINGQISWLDYSEDWVSRLMETRINGYLKFNEGKSYVCVVGLQTAPERAFAADCKFILNGSPMVYMSELETLVNDSSNLLGKYGISTRFYYTIFTFPFSAPKLSSVAANNSGVVFKWGKVKGAEKYRVYRKAEGETSWKKLADTTSTSYTDQTVKTGKTYTYTARCLTADGKAGNNAYNKTGLTITYCAKPELVSATNYNGGVKVTWKTVKKAEKYRILRKVKGGTSWKSVGYAGATKTTFKDTTVESGKTYIYTVRCVTADKSAYTSGYDTTGTKVAYIAAPVLKTPTIVTGGIKVAWKKSEGAKQYRILRKVKGATKWTGIGYAGATKTSYTDKTAKKGKTYIYSVRCMNADKTKYTSSYDSTGKTITYK